MLIPVVMAGGSGTRLWPLSRKLFPKQFLPLVSQDSMLQATLNRIDGLVLAEPITICNEEHRFIVAEQLRNLGKLGKIILEPMGKNTAPAVALSALVATSSGDDPLLLVLAADHVIEDEVAFRQAVSEGAALAENGKLVTFGIVPQSAHTGYGYIKQGLPLNDSAFVVESFVEKPHTELAAEYVESKQYLWNSGMFLFKASSYLKALTQYRPDILASCRAAMSELEDDLDFVRVDPTEFEQCADESIDYAVMEPLCAQDDGSVAVVPLDAGWNDVGSWASLQELADKDSDGNHLQGDVIAHNTQNTYVRGDKKLITMLGVKDLVIVDTPDALLVSSIDASQDVKKVVDKLKTTKRAANTISDIFIKLRAQFSTNIIGFKTS